MDNKFLTHSKPFFDHLEKHHALSEDCELIFVAWNFQTPENLGNLIRLAANIGTKTILMVNDNAQQHKQSKINFLARSALPFVEIINCQSTNYQQYIPSYIAHVALETCYNAQNIMEQNLPAKMALFLGNERTGLPTEVIESCTLKLYIPMPGAIKSMNVSHAATVAAFKWLSCHCK